MQNGKDRTGAVMVVGGGIAGMQASLDLANSGFKVYLVESGPAIGGKMSQLDKTFPTNDCAMCTISPRLVEVGTHRNIEILTNTHLEELEGDPGKFKVRLRKEPRYIDEEKCTGCGLCTANCPVRSKTYVDLEVSEVKIPDGDAAKVLAILERYASKKEFLVSVLQDIDAEYRYLPEFALRFVSKRLDVPLSQVYSVATFYTAFSLVPKGKFKVSVCLGTACHVRGGTRLLERFERELGIGTGETTEDKLFSLEAVRCLGCCGLAPVFTVNDDIYGKASQAQITKTIGRYRAQAETVR